MPAVSGRVLFWLPHLQASYHLQSTFSSFFLLFESVLELMSLDFGIFKGAFRSADFSDS